MLKADLVFEGAINQDYATVDFLTPLWQVIYQEAVRGHHLLFTGLPAEQTVSKATLARTKSQEFIKNLPKKITKLLKSSDLTAMQQQIATLSATEQSLLYVYYLRFIQDCMIKHRQSLN